MTRKNASRLPDGAPETPPLYRKPGYLIRRLQQAAVSIFLEETSEFDVTPVQYAMLSAVVAQPGIDQLRAANSIGFDRTTISGVTDRLELKNLLVRKVSGTDRRAKMLFATPQGIKLIANIEEATSRVQDRILQPLAPSEQRVFLEHLNRLVAAHNGISRVPVDDAGPKISVKTAKRTNRS
jgi:DNA-binding MarR family transcriptional regulator